MISETLALLSGAIRDEMLYAFENGEEHWIKLSDGYFVGVHIRDNPNLITLERTGVWSYGKVK